MKFLFSLRHSRSVLLYSLSLSTVFPGSFIIKINFSGTGELDWIYLFINMRCYHVKAICFFGSLIVNTVPTSGVLSTLIVP
jgi:hypothetical protein